MYYCVLLGGIKLLITLLTVACRTDLCVVGGYWGKFVWHKVTMWRISGCWWRPSTDDHGASKHVCNMLRCMDYEWRWQT